ncbi:hypothetical protein JVU11DRAFT_5813 [Chiua virens]|nr:hypothetical protein JVU11DRAFT_5813 [Chiua virens]
MDKSLDEVISTRPKARRVGRRTSAKAQILGNPTHVASRAAAQNAAAAKVVAAANPSPQPADKIIVSNLPADVNEVQIKVLGLLYFLSFAFLTVVVKELFYSTVGPLRDVTLHYDSGGRSKGIAAVHFQKKGDGTKAYQQVQQPPHRWELVSPFLLCFPPSLLLEQPLKCRGSSLPSKAGRHFLPRLLGTTHHRR